ncbi:MAG: hypothetical protein AAFX85_14635, partial [Pseudomonadota bacterium]
MRTLRTCACERAALEFTVFLALLLTALLASSASANEVADYAKLPAEQLFAVSPNGERLASVLRRDDRVMVIVRAADKQNKAEAVFVADAAGRDVLWLEWANDDRLLMSLQENAEMVANEVGFRLKRSSGFLSRRTMLLLDANRSASVELLRNVDGLQGVQPAIGLGDRFTQTGRYNLATSRIQPQNRRRLEPLAVRDAVLDLLPDDPEHVIVEADIEARGTPS